MKKIYTFSPQTNINEWQIVNDGVMGGVSKSKLTVTNDGFGKFSGTVSIENNGGFASVQPNISIKLESKHKCILLRALKETKNVTNFV